MCIGGEATGYGFAAGRGQTEDGLRTWREAEDESTSGDPESPEEKELVVTCNSIQPPKLWQTRKLINRVFTVHTMIIVKFSYLQCNSLLGELFVEVKLKKFHR